MYSKPGLRLLAVGGGTAWQGAKIRRGSAD